MMWRGGCLSASMGAQFFNKTTVIISVKMFVFYDVVKVQGTIKETVV